MIGWRWQSFGGLPMLVTDGDGAKVVLCAGQIAGLPVLMTRDPESGVLRGLVASDTFPAIIEAAPDLLAAAKLAAPHGARLQHGPNVSISAEAYRALCAAITKARAA